MKSIKHFMKEASETASGVIAQMDADRALLRSMIEAEAQKLKEKAREKTIEELKFMGE